MTTGSLYCPRIYALHPLLAGPLRDWTAQLERIAALGFDHLLLPPPFAPGAAGNPLLSGDYERLHPAFGDGATLEQIATACRKAGLTLLLDAVTDRVAVDGAFAAAHGDWLHRPRTDAVSDPRRPPQDAGAAQWRLEDDHVRHAAMGFWSKQLRRAIDAGVGGWRVHAPHRWQREFSEALIAPNPGFRFLAYTHRVPWDAFAEMKTRGFDAVFSSNAFWNFRDDWLFDEHEQLGRVAPSVIAEAEEPYGDRLGRRIARLDLRERAARRALKFAAGIGQGWVVPMGFEFGSSEPLNPLHGKPADFADLMRNPAYDLSAAIAAENTRLQRETPASGVSLRRLSGTGHALTALLRIPGHDGRRSDEATVLIVNTDLEMPASMPPAQLLGPAMNGLTALVETTLDDARPADEAPMELSLDTPVSLLGGELRLYRARRRKAVLAPAFSRGRRTVEAAVKAPRVAIERIAPTVDGGAFVVKRIVGDSVRVEADIFMDGHEQIAAALLWRAADETEWQQTPMVDRGNDRWSAEFPLERLGRYVFTIEAWRDAWGSYHHEIEKKHAARLAIPLELKEGRQYIEAAVQRTAEPELKAALSELLRRFDAATDDAQRTSLVLAHDTSVLMAAADDRPFAARHEPPLPIDAERPGAAYASWYELFPRSTSGSESRHGTFIDVIAQLPRVRDMGFDVLYFPPIHPIGKKHRKGRNNTLTPGPDDPGSPYAIGSADGGHDAIEPKLGTLDDFRQLRDAAAEHGLELALDFAIQCSPDHPWLKDHPEWFAWRPDGTIKYAENPPKKYEDIVNVDFYNDKGAPELWCALRDAILFWCKEGVRLFRVDNPHTKPLPFWKWMIADVRGRYPDAVFLSEAFTKPTLMRRLAKVGYSQSYTYFTWRNSKHELAEYLTELTQTEMREYYRPHFFVNTPDINPFFLQQSGRPGFLIRAALAATLSGLWGVYSGFEVCEARAMPGKEEYLDSEKYQIRAWDFDAPGNIVGEITLLNRIRKHNPALHSHLGVSFLNAWNDNILVYEKATPARDNVLIVVVNMDPHQAQECDFELPLWKFGIPDDGALEAEDLVSGARWTWHGKIQHVRIDPAFPFAVWRVRKP